MTMSQLIVQNAVKRTRKEGFPAFYSKTKESSLKTFIGTKLLAETIEKSLVNRFCDVVFQFPYSRVLELSTYLENNVLSQYEQDTVVSSFLKEKGVRYCSIG